MILNADQLRWICHIIMPLFRDCPKRCKSCRHYKTAIKVGDDDFVEGDFCVHFDNNCYWDDQKMQMMESKKCIHYQPRKKGEVYLGEVKPSVLKAYWVSSFG